MATPSEEPFEADPDFLDPTHDEPVRFSGVKARCGRADANCLPIPFNGHPKLIVGTILKSRYKPNARRTPVPDYAAVAGAEPCLHDGECLTGGGGRCVRWDTELGDEYTTRGHALFDAYCGCVQKQCQGFTQPRRKIHLDFESIRVDGWPKRLPVDRDELDLAKDFVLQQEIRRCFVNHVKQLPRRIVFTVEQKRDRDQQTGNVKGAPAEVARCIEQLIPSISVSLRDVTDAELAQHPIKLEVTIAVSVKTVP